MAERIGEQCRINPLRHAYVIGPEHTLPLSCLPLPHKYRPCCKNNQMDSKIFYCIVILEKTS
jgi:hypothetical protein